jgi:hypothetical protein
MFEGVGEEETGRGTCRKSWLDAWMCVCVCVCECVNVYLLYKNNKRIKIYVDVWRW